MPTRDKPVSYAKEVSDILDAKCVGCHNAALAEGKLLMEDVAGVLKGGKHGPAIKPGRRTRASCSRWPRTGSSRSCRRGQEGRQAAHARGAGPAQALDRRRGEGRLGRAPRAGPDHPRRAPGGVRPIVAVDLTEDGKLVAAGRGNRVFVYEVASGKELASLGGHKDIIQSLRFSPDGKKLAAGSYEFATVWDLPADLADADRRAQEVRPARLPGPGDRLQPRRQADGDGRRRAVEVGRGQGLGRGERATSSGRSTRSTPTPSSALRFSPDGAKLATASADKFLKVIQVEDGKDLKSFEGHTHHVLAVDWSGDGKQLVTGGADNVLKVWDFETGEQLRTLQAAGKQVTAVRWVPGKPLVAGASGDSTVKFWNPNGNGNVVRTFNGAGDYVFGVATSKDGKVVAAGGADGVLFVWNGDDGKVIRKVEPSSRPAKLASAAKIRPIVGKSSSDG